MVAASTNHKMEGMLSGTVAIVLLAAEVIIDQIRANK
jgi:hypothetical protein